MDIIVDLKSFPLLDSTLTDKSVFKRIRLLCIFGCNASEVIFATNDDKIYSFGRNRFGGLGLGTDSENYVSPQLNPYLSDKQVVNIFCGFEHWIALTRSGRCLAWGHNQYGQLGNTDVGEASTKPVLIADLATNKVVELSCGAVHTLARTSDGRVYGWGDNQYGQIGDGTTQCCYYPKIIHFEEEVIAISCGRSHSIALTLTGKVYIWGLNSYGQLGTSAVNNKRYIYSWPQLIPDFEDIPFSKAICGPNFSLLLASDGCVYAFGDNACGQIGNGSTECQWTPFKVSEDIKFKDIIAHKENDISVAVSMDDKFYVWGLAKNRRYLSPKEVTNSSQMSVFDLYAIYAKKNVTFKTIVINNELKSWERAYRPGMDSVDINGGEMIRKLEGISFDSYIDDINSDNESDDKNSNDWQQINRNKSKRHKPKRVTIDKVMDLKMYLKNPKIINDSMIRSIRLIRIFGLYGSKVIFATNDDKVYGFGHNRDLSLGLSTSEEHILQPELIKELCGQQLVDIATGYEHCIALTASGLCYGWGQNSFGQLGIGSINPSNKPKLIQELADTKIVQINCGSYHCLALSSDGELFSWGHNTFAQLGDRTYNSREKPTQVMVPESIAFVTCGLNHSVALTAKGTVYVWGGNERGQLGRPPELDVRVSREKPMSNRPHVIKQLENIVIIKAVCGSNHTLLLSNTGGIYSFGDNSCGQVGNGTTTDQYLPMKLNKELKIKDIISQYDNDMSIAVTEDNKCFVWGFVQKKNILKPTEISNSWGKSLFDIYAKLAKHKITFKTIVVEEDFQKYLMPENPDIKAKKRVKVFNSVPNTEHSVSYSQITATNGNTSVGKERNGSESVLQNYKIKSIWDMTEDLGSEHEFEVNLDIVSNSGTIVEEVEEEINGEDINSNSNFITNAEEMVEEVLEEVEEDITIASNLQTSAEEEKDFTKCQNLMINLTTVPEVPQHLDQSQDSGHLLGDTEDICGNLCLIRLRQSFNDRNTSDLVIRSGDRVIYCHKTVLSIRNEIFWGICSKELNENNEISINPEVYPPFEAFLQFLYSIRPKIDDNFAEKLQSMAKIFGETQLYELCAQVIRKSEVVITLSNVCPLYEKAVKEVITDLEEKCIEFATNNWKSVIKSDGFEVMDDSLSKRLIVSVMSQ